MKKTLLLSFLMLFISSLVMAQLEKGHCFTAGYSNLGLDIGKSKTKQGSTTNENYKYTEFWINPEAGHFIADNLVVGGFLDIYFDNYKYPSDNKSKYSTLIIGPIVRYYLMKLDKLCPYAAAKVGVGTAKSTSTYSGNESSSKETYFTTKIGVGSTYFMTPNFGIDAFLGYDYDAWSQKGEEDGGVKSALSEKTTDTWGSVEFNMGLVFVFGK